MRRLFYTSLMLLAFAGICLNSALSAQDIILLDQNGEKVGVAKVGDKKAAEDAANIVQSKPGDAKNKVGGNAKGKVKATMANGVISITREDGSTEEINLSDARSVVISRSSKTVVGEDGQQQSQTVGKAIVIGPDGVRREIELNNNGDGVSGIADDANRPKTWMIGVSVAPVSPLLRTHLKLEEGSGLVVERVFSGGAADIAGIKANDILLFAEQKLIGTREQLSQAVNEAGADGSPVNFIILRSGEETSISVKPTEREGIAGFGGMNLDIDALGGLKGLDGMDFEFKQFGPGIIIGGQPGVDMRFEFKNEIDQRLKDMQKQVEEMHRALREDRR